MTAKKITAPCGCSIDSSSGAASVSDKCRTHGKLAKDPLLVRMLPGSIQESLARRSLEKKLAFNLNACRSHEKNKLARGHGAYALLYNEAVDLIDEFACRHMPGLERDDARRKLFAQYPAMYVLKAKSVAPAASGKGSKPRLSVGLVIASAILLPMMLGLGSGLYHGVEAWVLKLFGG